MALRLRQIEVRASTARERFLGVVEEVQAEVDERADNLLAGPSGALLRDVLFVQVPAARPDDERGSLLVQPVDLALLVHELDIAADGIAKVRLAGDDVLPRGRQRVLAV